MSLLDDVIGKAETLLQELKDASAALDASAEMAAAEAPETAAAAPAVAAVPDLPSDDASAGEGHDNSLPFKCPACGKTYETQVVCTNDHPAEATLPTADVLAGAEPGGAATAANGVGEDPQAAAAAEPGGGAESSSSSSISDPPKWPA